ncbi:hypothetical protein F511_18526 [Dorcoceras hygrometricum]|uniref:S-protein homolog n=1 Tax=Dorcoceras hygrometricum TaxID=472368 RepID=A0A2Z7B629_9LAMI|nr:hypothetical protein F511_18526 [Dorcoceras hygrometricum]
MGNFLFVLYLMANVVQSVRIEKSACDRSDQYWIFVSDRLSENPVPLQMSCISGMRDLGEQILNFGQYYSWRICNFQDDPETFFCHLVWGSKQVLFKSFNVKLARRCRLNTCYWYVRNDGVYFKRQKVKDWRNSSVA